MGCDENGIIQGVKASVVSDTGAFASLGGPVLERACTHGAGPYQYEAYEIDGRRVTEFPYDIQDDVKPVYREFKGWKTDLKQVRRYEDFPAEFKTYVEYIERETGVPVAIISVGPDRDETIVR